MPIRVRFDPSRVRIIWLAIRAMEPNASMRLSLSIAVGLTTLVCALLASDAGSAPLGPGATYHPSAVKGQTIELEISAPPNAPRMTLKMQQKEAMVDLEPPFRFSISTADLRPAAKYKWHSSASGTGCCDSQGGGGAIQIYPLPRVRAPKVSALVVAGTARVVGLVVSRVARGRAVRAWSFPRHTENGLLELPLQLRQRRGAKRVYRFAGGLTVNVGRRTEIDVEVAPARRTLRHGVEVRGRLARLWLTRDRRSGATRAHRSVVIACTTAKVRKESFPGRQSCTTASPNPPVSIFCAKSVPCVPGAAFSARRD
jgi:hypothetical protein